MKTIIRYLKILFLSLSFFFLTQGCSFYMGFHVKSKSPSEIRTAHSVISSEGGTTQTVSR